MQFASLIRAGRRIPRWEYSMLAGKFGATLALDNSSSRSTSRTMRLAANLCKLRLIVSDLAISSQFRKFYPSAPHFFSPAHGAFPWPAYLIFFDAHCSSLE